MKKNFVLTVMVAILFSFSVSFGEEYNFFFDLVGKDSSYVKSNYPLYEMMPKNSAYFPGYYIVQDLECMDGGSIGVLVGFINRKGKDVVRDVVLIMDGCKVDPPNENTIYDALGTFSYLYGFENQGKDFSKNITLEVNKPDFILMLLPELSMFSVSKTVISGDLFFSAEAGKIITD